MELNLIVGLFPSIVALFGLLIIALFPTSNLIGLDFLTEKYRGLEHG